MTTLENNVDNGATTETVMVEIPAIFQVQGARKDVATFDASKYDAKGLQEFINQAVKVLCQRASASVDGLEEKKKAEHDKLTQIINGEYKAGARKTSAPVSVEARAEEQLLMRLFEKQGANTEAKQRKLARQENAWEAYYLQAISVKLNREDVTSEEVQLVMEAQGDAIAAMIAAEVEAVKAEDERKAKGTTEIDFGDILG